MGTIAPDFKKIDEVYDFKKYKDKLEKANKLGYKYVSEAAYRLYYEEGVFLTRITRLLGYNCDSHMYIFFCQMGWKTDSHTYKENFKYGGAIPNFELLDKTMKMAYLSDKMEAVEKLGYIYFHEAIYDLYYNKKQSFSQIGPQVGYSHHNSLQAVFRKLSWPSRPRGGANYGAKVRAYKDDIYAKWLLWENKEKGAVDFCVAIAQEYSCSVHTIKNWVYRGGWKQSFLMEKTKNNRNDVKDTCQK